MTKPIIDFLVIGAQKAGTTWISHLMGQHPEIHVPPRKELHYFNNRDRLARGLDWYRAQFAPRPGERFNAEATPNYFWNAVLPGDRQGVVHRHEIAPAVRHLNPDVRLILSLRDPVERAVSAYYHYIATGQIHPAMPFAEALDWYGARTMGLYPLHLRHWLEQFPREQILVLVFERDIRKPANRPATVARIFGHLGLPVPERLDYDTPRNARASYFAMQTARFVRPTGLPGKAVRFLSRQLVPRSLDKRFKPRVSEEERARLRDYYRPHVAETSRLLGLELEREWS